MIYLVFVMEVYIGLNYHKWMTTFWWQPPGGARSVANMHVVSKKKKKKKKRKKKKRKRDGLSQTVHMIHMRFGSM